MTVACVRPDCVSQAALRQITDKAREFGAGPLFNQILPLLMSPTLEDQERHLLVKVIDRILYKLDDLVRPYVHKVGGETTRPRGFFTLGFNERRSVSRLELFRRNSGVEWLHFALQHS